MEHCNIKTDLPDAPAGFPFAIVNHKGEVVAWVKNKRDAEFVKTAAARISELQNSNSRNRALYLSKAAR